MSYSRLKRSEVSAISCSFSNMKIVGPKKEWRFIRMDNFFSFFMLTMAAVFTPALSIDDRKGDDADGMNIIQSITTYLLVAMPLFYLEVFFGQYTQRGASHIAIMTPFFRGLNMSLAIAVFFRLVRNGLYMTDFLLYTILALQPKPPWDKCPSRFAKTCWSPLYGNCTSECLTEDIKLSSYIFWKYVYLDDPLSQTGIVVSPLWNRSVMMIFNWLVTMIFIIFIFRHYKKFVIGNFLISVIFSILFLMVCLVTGGLSTIFAASDLSLGPLLKLIAWQNSIGNLVNQLGLGTACHIEHGTDLTPKISTGFLSMCSIFVLLLQTYVVSLVTNSTAKLVKDKAKLSEMKYLSFLDVLPNFTVIPSGISLLPAPYVWLLFHNIFCISSAATSQVVELMVLQRCLVDTYPRMAKYIHYMTFMIIIVIILFSIVFLCNNLLPYTTYFCMETIRTIEICNCLFFTIAMCWVYGVRQIADDIHFFSGNPPAFYWKICWFFLPLMIMLPAIEHVFSRDRKDYSTKVFHWIIVALALWPILVMAIVEIFNKAKDNDLVGIFRAQEGWGPSDPEDRYNRRKFKPRDEIKITRTIFKCKHDCLQNSDVIKDFIREETKKRNTVPI